MAYATGNCLSSTPPSPARNAIMHNTTNPARFTRTSFLHMASHERTNLAFIPKRTCRRDRQKRAVLRKTPFRGFHHMCHQVLHTLTEMYHSHLLKIKHST